ncbi:MAG: hypothetical protein WCY65_02300 [Candidatus Methanomethylophilaceae archaeon]
MEAVTVGLALLLLLVVPGLIMSFAIFLPNERIFGPDRLDQRVSRLILSVALSLLLVPASTYLLNYFLDLGPNQSDLFLVLAVSILIASASLALRLGLQRLTSR